MRKIRQNIYGNWCGYISGRRVQEFGTDEIAAGYWLLTGVVDFNAGYDYDQLDACRDAARSSL